MAEAEVVEPLVAEVGQSTVRQIAGCRRYRLSIRQAPTWYRFEALVVVPFAVAGERRDRESLVRQRDAVAVAAGRATVWAGPLLGLLA